VIPVSGHHFISRPLESRAVLAKPIMDKPAYTVLVTTERPDAIYRVGEQISFVATVERAGETVTEGELRFTIAEDGMEPVTKGRIPLSSGSVQMPAKLGKPGFIQCRVPRRGLQPNHRVRGLQQSPGTETDHQPPHNGTRGAGGYRCGIHEVDSRTYQESAKHTVAQSPRQPEEQHP